MPPNDALQRTVGCQSGLSRPPAAERRVGRTHSRGYAQALISPELRENIRRPQTP